MHEWKLPDDVAVKLIWYRVTIGAKYLHLLKINYIDKGYYGQRDEFRTQQSLQYLLFSITRIVI